MVKILVTGSTGLVGSKLVPYLVSCGHDVDRLKRGEPQNGGDPVWAPSKNQLEASQLEGYDAIVHLAGENIASGRWTDDKKRSLRDSRINGTNLIVEALSKLKEPPKVLVTASAIGFYGDRGEEELTEESKKGNGFLADLCKDWEETARKAEDIGIRTVNLRIGVVLSPEGGMLQKILPPFQMGAGGRIGSGEQYMSWISIDDLVKVIHHVVEDDSAKGPVNAVAPEPVTNSAFTEALGKVLSRPTIFPVPEFGAKLAFGEMAEELMLASSKVIPEKLISKGYQFSQPKIEGALRHVLGK